MNLGRRNFWSVLSIVVTGAVIGLHAQSTGTSPTSTTTSTSTTTPQTTSASKASTPVAPAKTGAAKPASAKTSTATKPSSTAAKPASTTAKATVAAPATTRADLARARAAEQARQAAAERQQKEMAASWKRDALGNIVPNLHAAAAIIFNPQTGEVVWEENSHDQRSIASLTKMMTAVTFIADDPDLDREVTVARSDVANASVTYLSAGDRLTLGEVLHLTLIASDNAAARVLARTSDGGTAAFVGRMNDKARQLGLTNTRYADPTGLDADDMSTAYDLSHLIAFAVADEHLGPIMRTQLYDVHVGTHIVSIHSTNKLLGSDMDIRGGKTGFISKAGYCLATLTQIPQGSQVAIVVLGAADSATRFGEARHLFDWVVGKTQGIIGGGDWPLHKH